MAADWIDGKDETFKNFSQEYLLGFCLSEKL